MRRLRARTSAAAMLVVALPLGMLLTGSTPGGAAGVVAGGAKRGVQPQS